MNGFLIADKPEGWTSYQVVSQLKRWTGVEKIGHLGTLDPMATGVLVLALGQATKVIPFIQGFKKGYRGEMTLGVETDTQDRTGQVLATRPVQGITENLVRETFARFTGTQLQEPPMFSAKRVNGQRLYKLARKGETVRRHPAEVTIHRLDLISLEGDKIRFEAEVSSGTYIRTLSKDVGDALGVGAHLSALERTFVGPFTLMNSLKLNLLEEKGLSLEPHLIPINRVLEFIPEIRVAGREEVRFQNGNYLEIQEVGLDPTGLSEGTRYRVCTPLGDLIGIGELQVKTAPGREPGLVLQPIRNLWVGPVEPVAKTAGRAAELGTPGGLPLRNDSI